MDCWLLSVLLKLKLAFSPNSCLRHMVACSRSFSFGGVLSFQLKSQFVPLWVVFDCICFIFLRKSSVGLYLVVFAFSCLLCPIVFQALASFNFIN